MSPSLQPHVFPITGQRVRTLWTDDTPWFVARDVALALGYTNPRKAVRDHVPAAHRRGTDSFPPADLGELEAQTVLISEAGLYRLIMRSHTALAEAFQEWVTADVLPSIRRTGQYGTTLAVPTSFAEALELAAKQARDLEAAREQVSQLTPAADAWDALAAAAGDYALRDAAQLLSRDPAITIGQNRLAAYLKSIGWTDATGQPYQRHVDTGRLVRRTRTYEHPRTREERITTQLRITAKGVRELRNLLGGGAQLALEDAG
jgi:prophage antirepressor-like protein